MTTRWPVRVLGCLVGALALIGVRASTHATWVLTHGGSRAFDGAFDYPPWAAAHFLGGLVFIVILPFQLSSRVRGALPRLHRIAGRVAAGAGLAFASTGVALPIVMPARPFGERAFMLTVAVAFPFLLWRGIAAARRHDFVSHRRWMLRVTAGGLSPLTQRAIFPFFAALGIDSLARFWDLFVTAAWLGSVLNFVVVEWWIQRTEAAAARRFAERNAPESVRSLGTLAPPQSGVV